MQQNDSLADGAGTELDKLRFFLNDQELPMIGGVLRIINRMVGMAAVR